MNEHLWNIVRADVHFDEPKPMEWYFVRDAKRQIVCGPLRKVRAVEIAAAHNDVVMAMMETLCEARAPRARYEGLGA